MAASISAVVYTFVALSQQNLISTIAMQPLETQTWNLAGAHVVATAQVEFEDDCGTVRQLSDYSVSRLCVCVLRQVNKCSTCGITAGVMIQC